MSGLEDPTYEPQHPPREGEVPLVVEKWGPRSQVRWFARFSTDLKPQPAAYWSRFYVSSVQHRGECCVSCQEDGEVYDDACCCIALKNQP